MIAFPPKITTEVNTVSFDFLGLLALGETISSAAVTVEVSSGTDASPSDLLSGGPSADGTIVSQKLTGGVAGVIYCVICAITTSEGQELILQGLVAVVSTNPF